MIKSNIYKKALKKHLFFYSNHKNSNISHYFVLIIIIIPYICTLLTELIKQFYISD
jgi:ABC-type phosphate transport system permease subunit